MREEVIRVKATEDSVIFSKDDFDKLLYHLGESHGHPGLAMRLRQAASKSVAADDTIEVPCHTHVSESVQKLKGWDL